jgi:hypothetical protein
MTKNSTIREVEKLEAAMETNPPVIEWRLDPRSRVMVAWSVHDPYPDGAHNGEKTSCKRGHRYTAENTIHTSGGWRQCRTCKNEDRKPLTDEQKQRALELKRLRRQQRKENAA